MNRSEIEAALVGVALPASKRELLDYAARQERGERVAELLRALPEREFRSLDEVGEELEPRQPEAWKQPFGTKLPREESDVYPGGRAYLGERVEPANVVAARSS